MSLAKLKRRYPLQNHGSSALSTLRQCQAELNERGLSAASDADLIKEPFEDWCKTLKIKSAQGLKPFELFPWQEKTASLIVGSEALKGRTIVLLSSRQTGKTSLMLAIQAYLAQSRAQYTGLMIHKSGADASLLCRRLKRFLDDKRLPIDSMRLLEFRTRSTVHFRSSNPMLGEEGAEGAGRGLDSVDCLMVEESGHTANLDAVLGVVGPALTWGDPRVTVLIGTASSKTSRFYELLAESAGGPENLELILAGIRAGTEEPFQVLGLEGKGPVGVISNWRCIDRFRKEDDFLGRVKQEFGLSEDQIAREYELTFGSSGDSSVFPFALVNPCIQGEWDNDPNGAFYAGVDAAAQGSDYCTCVILRKLRDGSFKAVKLYRNRKGSSDLHLANISEMIEHYRPIKTIVETNNVGQIYLESLKSANPRRNIDGSFTTKQAKETLVGRITLALEKDQLTFPKSVISTELLNFRRTGPNQDRLEAPKGKHDDSVIALGLALEAANYGKLKND